MRSADKPIYKREISERRKNAVTELADCGCLGVVRIGPPHPIIKVEVGIDQLLPNASPWHRVYTFTVDAGTKSSSGSVLKISARN